MAVRQKKRCPNILAIELFGQQLFNAPAIILPSFAEKALP